MHLEGCYYKTDPWHQSLALLVHYSSVTLFLTTANVIDRLGTENGKAIKFTMSEGFGEVFMLVSEIYSLVPNFVEWFLTNSSKTARQAVISPCNNSVITQCWRPHVDPIDDYWNISIKVTRVHRVFGLTVGVCKTVFLWCNENVSSPFPESLTIALMCFILPRIRPLH